MERTISPEEKIRRAEEIYARRKNGYSNSRNIATVNVSQEKDFGLFKKMILQILICLVICFIYYLIQNSNYIFSQEVINKTKEILSYDIDIKGIYVQITNMMSNFSIDDTKTQTNTIENQNTIENNQNNEQNNQNSVEDNQNSNNNSENERNTQEAKEDTVEYTKVAMEEEQEKPQTNEEYIKSKYNFIKPVEGIVSSEFGARDVDNPIVSKNHKGIDIAANKGVDIKASIAGIVTVSSTTGDYGYHIEIQNEDIKTLYAHCSELNVQQGESVAQGQVIAKVGDTGKATSAHLHFEIRRDDTYINPRDILEF